MHILEKQAIQVVSGAGYWVTNCDFFGCYDEYIYDVQWVPGYWAPAEWVTVYDPYFGNSSIYTPAMWVDGVLLYY